MDVRARNILAREREQQAIQLRKEGNSYRAIGKILGVSDKAVIKMVRRVLDRLEGATKENANELREIELERLDDMLRGIYPEAQMGDPVAIKVCLSIMERRSAYLGLDAPKQSKVGIDVTTDIDGQIAGIVERLKSRGQVPPTLEANSSTRSIDASRNVVNLVNNSGTWVGEDASRG